MVYRALALKYRPTIFDDVIGQDHITISLKNALNRKMLHHAYLFTGTRGVGKTTLSRILAKSFNCKNTNNNKSIPCNICESCISINKDRFIDYIEIDAASNRGINEINSLLEKVIYMPSNALYKIYMIDEVHMLTNYAFNAMLKILENPPKHIKFILATTEIKKIPATILSRCLQFNLRKISLNYIKNLLIKILKKENIKFEESAINLLAKNAHGSMRDALSLTDQIISYSNNKITLNIVQKIIGSLDDLYLIKILYALLNNDSKTLFFIASKIEKYNLSYNVVLQDLSTLLHNINLIQVISLPKDKNLLYENEILILSSKFTKEEIQIFYQIVIHGRNELSLAPDELTGFSMTLLRMLAFYPKIQNIISNFSDNNFDINNKKL